MKMKQIYQIIFACVWLCLIAVMPALGQVGRAGRETIFALTSSNRLISFNSNSPATVSSPLTISGLQQGETLVGIDFRPASRILFGVSNQNRIYTINTMTGAATQVGSSNFTLNGTVFGIDFNPAPDRIRLVGASTQNLRLNPIDGTLAGTDGALAFAMGDTNAGRTPNVVSAAYTNNYAGIGATTTTLYVIDSNLDALLTQGSVNATPVNPNTGQLFTVGSLGINVSDATGFDISDVNGAAFLTTTLPGAQTSTLFTLNLATGAATAVGTIGGMETVRDIAVAVNGETILVATASGRITAFNSTNPSTPVGSIQVTGLSQGDALAGFDFRPATGQLFAIGTSGQIYTISPVSGAATRVGMPNMVMGTNFAVDFNPAPDRIRFVTNTGQNLRFVPDTGALAGTDGNIAFDMADPNAGRTPNIVACAYTNNVAGTPATGTTLYNIDAGADILVTQGSVNATPVNPNTGTLFTIAPLGIDITDGVFDISDASGVGYGIFTVAGSSTQTLFRVNLPTAASSTPVTVRVGDLPLTDRVVGLAVVLRVENIFGLTNDNRLVRFNPRLPSALIGAPVTITGLQSGENLLGIDYRPATGFLFGLGSTSRVYVINPSTGAATALGAGPFTPALMGNTFGFDFNPQPDRIRLVSNATQNLRLNPNNGGLAGADGALAYAMGDPNAGRTPNVVAVGYTNSFAGTAVTTLYDIDSGLDVLVTQGSLGSAPVSPNTGQLFTVGSLGVNTTDTVAFDISEQTGTAYAAFVLMGESSSRFYTLNLQTGAATQVGMMPVGGAAPVTLRSIAVFSNVGLSVVAVAPAAAVTSGSDLTYTVTVANGSADPAANVVLTTATPASTAFRSITTPTGFNCTTPAAGATGAITCTGQSLAGGATAQFSIVVVPTVTMNNTNVALATTVRTDTVDITNRSFNTGASTATAVVNLPPGPTVVAANIRVSNQRLKATISMGGMVPFTGTTVLVDGVAFQGAATIRDNNLTLIQRGRLANGSNIKTAIPRGRMVMITFRNANGGVTVVPFTRSSN